MLFLFGLYVPSGYRKSIKRSLSKEAKRSFTQSAQSGLFAQQDWSKTSRISSQISHQIERGRVPTRYPETLELLKRDYTQGVVEDILFKSKEVLEWIKNQR
jgi:HEPN domain-containing protein